MTVETSTFRVPTDGRESDGTLERDPTTRVAATVSRDGVTGRAYGYGPAAVAHVIDDQLTSVAQPDVAAGAGCAMAGAAHLEDFHDHRRIEAMLFDGLPAREGPFRVPDPATAGHGQRLRS